MERARWKIHKFGGSSLADAECFRRVAEILKRQPTRPLGVVVSAMRGMTDTLLALVEGAQRGTTDHDQVLGPLRERYAEAAEALLSPENRAPVLAAWEKDASDLGDLLRAIALVRSADQRSRDVAAGFGELWSARLLAAFLDQEFDGAAVDWLDARRALTVHQTELGPSVIWDVSRRRTAAAVPAETPEVLVITGFIAEDEQGLQTTLGRNGSDFSAAIFAVLLDADELSIWTDVDGVMSGDPNRVPEAKVIDTLSYNEAMELAYFGAKVIHPQTMGPAVANSIPILIRNTFAPDHPGTRVVATSGGEDKIKGITAIDGVALVNVEGAGMIGVPGTADRIFGALREADVSVILISQASSEHSICFAVPELLADTAREVVSDAFAEELESGQIQRVEVTPSCSILAVVGDGMSGTPGVAGRFLNTLGRAGINVSAIAQGSSERNISAVVRQEDSTRALRAVHSGFYLSAKTISIGIIGPGMVGSTLLAQIAEQAGRLREQFNLDLRIRAIATSSKMLLDERRIDLTDWQSALAEHGEDTDLDRLADHIHADHLPHSVLIDCTASDKVAARYAQWLRRGIHVVTPNKKAFSVGYDYYRELQEAAREGSSHYFYETTVGAALPVIQALRDLRETGDRIDHVEGIFSGTLAYLFNTFDGSRPFSEIVAEARASGYTEPDPRDDLSGMDVARKVIILAREMGLALDVSELDIRSLVPAELESGSVEDFLRELPKFDDEMQRLFDEARDSGKVLRYVGRLDRDGRASVDLVQLDRSHPFSNINLTDNVVQFVSERYSANPLVIQGPGAGPAVTAAGIFADLLRLTAYVGGEE
ncbi:bifunctional aspartate kinase/homoserine dehydrogenase I [Lentisalinibacter salinarum]|uniref:bifunctional aspartate kinase/homoserine dehydrogenase I n=1 Tax=Lentisalinibacter salinarum TaxID=2992239 RepID=UPI00386A999D